MRILREQMTGWGKGKQIQSASQEVMPLGKIMWTIISSDGYIIYYHSGKRPLWIAVNNFLKRYINQDGLRANSFSGRL